jgi:ABC-2 type transport system permease protein
MSKSQARQNLRTITAIASKDISDALRSRVILLNLGVLVLLLLLIKFTPRLWKPNRLDFTFYDAGASSLIAALTDQPDIRLFESESQADLIERLNDGDQGPLGVIIPADYDQSIAAGKVPVLRGFLLWSQRNSADTVKAKVEERLEYVSGNPVHIEIEGLVDYAPDAMGEFRITALIVVYALFYIGLFATPQLMMEEKQTKTMNSLLVSPASTAQVVAGKALAGIFFVLVTASAALAFNWTFIVHWDIAILGLLSGALLGVSLGLLLGVIFENKQQLNTWMMILAQPLLISLFLSVIDPIFPQLVRDLLAWIPTVALSLVFRYAFSSGATISQIMTSLGIILGSSILLLMGVMWKVAVTDHG